MSCWRLGSKLDVMPALDRTLLRLATAVCLTVAASELASFAGAAADSPNIVVLFIDDLGHGDIGAYGCPDFKTPHIDSLARDGVRCTNGYSTCPLCSPSRAALMTGMYPQRFGVFGNTDRGQPIPADHPTLAELLRDAGYVTGMVGRWDLGDAKQGPLESGFMEVARRSKRKRPKDPDIPSYWGEDGSYCTEIQGEELVDFVTRHRDRPFFLYFAPLAVHSPVEEAPQRYLDRVDSAVPEPRRSLGATLVALDDAIGELLVQLSKLGLDERTLIFFTGDNGGWEPDQARNAPYRGGKATAWEGGVHEPYIVRWTGRLKPGTSFPGLVSTLDIYATAAAAAGAPPPNGLDGVDLLPFLGGRKTGSPHEYLFWRWESATTYFMKAVRCGDLRYVVDGDRGTSERRQLFDLADDASESRDLIAERQEDAKRLAANLTAWESKLPEYVPRTALPQSEPPAGRDWATAKENEDDVNPRAGI